MIWTLVKKELISLICSAYFFFFALIYLGACSLMLWILPGSFNIIDNGYATLDRFFDLSAILLMILIPALTMKSLSEEKLTKTIDLLYSRPISPTQLYLSKVIAVFLSVLFVIISTLIYAYTIYSSSIPFGNLDISKCAIAYIALFLIIAIFISIGVFSSAVSKHQIISFITAIVINFLLFFGFDLISQLIPHETYALLFIKSLSLSTHFNQLQRGVVELSNIIVLINYLCLFWLLTTAILYRKNKYTKSFFISWVSGIVLINTIILIIPTQRIDFTSDQRYTLNKYSINVLEALPENKLKINIYLDGNLNYSFRELQNSVKNLLYDFNKYAKGRLDIQFINPSEIPVKGDELPYFMAEQGMPPITLNEKDRDGKISQQLIYPYAQLIHENDTLQIQLLKNILGNTAQENFAMSTDNLEFEFIDAIQLLINKEEIDIAFIEGHGELTRTDLYDVEEALAKYYFINRGQITDDTSILNNFKVIIIAGSQEKFSEAEKYVLDQYLMNGGRILWFIDGAKVSQEQLSVNGQSPSMKNETNLDDLLLTYGVRINSDLLEDLQASDIVVKTESESQPTIIPWSFSPLFIPSFDNPITKNIAYVRAPLSSSISLLKNSASLAPMVLLTTSANTHIVQVPEMINFDINKSESNNKHFNQSYIPTAVALSGNFTSAFQHRPIPDSIKTEAYINKEVSLPTKMIVVSSSQLIKNEIISNGDQTQVLPIGYDRISGVQYGNRDFIINAVNWLANDDEWLSVRKKQIKQRILNKQLVLSNRNYYTTINSIVPIMIIGIFIGLVMLYRHNKYSK